MSARPMGGPLRARATLTRREVARTMAWPSPRTSHVVLLRSTWTASRPTRTSSRGDATAMTPTASGRAGRDRAAPATCSSRNTSPRLLSCRERRGARSATAQTAPDVVPPRPQRAAARAACADIMTGAVDIFIHLRSLEEAGPAVRSLCESSRACQSPVPRGMIGRVSRTDAHSMTRKG